MGACLCKGGTGGGGGDELVAARWPQVITAEMTGNRVTPEVDSVMVDQLILEMLELIASFVDNDEDSPVSLVKLHVIADRDEGWIQMISSIINVIPLEDPFGPSAITILLDDCPLPSREAVIKMTNLLRLSAERAKAPDMNVRVERNICVVLGCIAEKLAGPNSVAVFTENTLDYLLTFLVTRREGSIVLFSLIALEKFANTTENKLNIKSRLEKEAENPLLVLETYADCDDEMWRQVGFCAKWALDNLFIVEGRKMSYEQVDMTDVNIILNCRDVSEYLKISSNGLEARCDSYSFESVRSTYQVDNGCWYYEAVIITPGVMQIGWATKNSHFLNHWTPKKHYSRNRTSREGYGIGDDLYSLAYDGCRRLIWYKAKPIPVRAVPSWQPGDVLGCLIDIAKRELIFSLNGTALQPCREIFDHTRYGFYAAASFMAFQQCRFNFGHEPYKFPPTDRHFFSFNEHAFLTENQKTVIPRRLFMEQLRSSSDVEDACTLCFDDSASCSLEPCGHEGFCSVCTSYLKECPSAGRRS